MPHSGLPSTGHIRKYWKGLQQRATEMIKRLECLSYEERPREEKAQWDLINVFKYLIIYQGEGLKRMEPGSSQWCPVTGPEAMGTN